MGVDCNLEAYPEGKRARMWSLNRVYPFFDVEGHDKFMAAEEMIAAINALPPYESGVEFGKYWRSKAIRYLTAVVKRFGADTKCRIVDDMLGGTECDSALWDAEDARRTSRMKRKGIPQYD